MTVSDDELLFYDGMPEEELEKLLIEIDNKDVPTLSSEHTQQAQNNPSTQAKNPDDVGLDLDFDFDIQDVRVKHNDSEVVGNSPSLTFSLETEDNATQSTAKPLLSKNMSEKDWSLDASTQLVTEKPEFISTTSPISQNVEVNTQQVADIQQQIAILSEQLQQLTEPFNQLNSQSEQLSQTVRNLQKQTKQHFAFTNEKLYELRTTLIYSRKNFIELASLLEAVKEALNVEVYAKQ